MTSVGHGRLLRAGIAVLAVLAVLLPATAVRADPVEDAEEQIEREYHDLEAVIEDYNKISKEFKDTKKQVAKLEKELKPFEEKLSVLYERVAEIASNVYMGGSLSGMTAVLTTGTPDNLAERITLLDQVTVDDSTAIDELNAAKAELDERKSVLDSLYADQSGREEELREKKETIETDLERLQEQREKAYRDSRGIDPDDFVPPYIPGDRGKVVNFALKQVGLPYIWASSGPDGFDCSGLTLRAWSQVGLDLPHNAEAQWNMLPHIPRDQLQPGDLVFYNDLSHVAMYIGDGYVVQAAINYNNVAIETLDGAASDYYGAARIPGF
ncbi:C40 family peptidase [Phytomonospora endophytica]|uniref:Cell wall-associated NlpC family hydrolase n=1 Tax=Phytomonospora endophytica TaxID=714109 RepID=A0A841FIR7_9ACTN|nr:C40 family peptidase [Phytomonospora endophytica]MBB6036096.1 cell wall-associated NlpC family hydrolase [Phytomonospora endophytica]GIG66999.1 hypothetical protein Pen01_32940 [Phytomonospora endophytica]